ncbi:MurR/RpiR family transcriptional regulator [Erysipelothrix piscisicarius]|uniref:MurR/RpiR family transcriptional regulator n=1 Tax=Erysipelothrix piscisicarius TaxID=2485784 RepID=A0A3Q8S2N0_9FIRM|nr:MurR/RpiR family transcriptional regulator [Erysipelothrix piscisicarius]AZK44025.1 MurR/RpiR family transcriptional regulator [Erysipelothrix piscisicarius]
MDILDEIQKQYVNFSQKEKQIAMYILQKNNEIRNINIGKLAEQTGTSSATITRFCRKIGCESFVDMKIQISAAEQDGIPLESSDIFDSVYSYYNRVIDRTKKNINKEELERVITALKDAQRIFIYGVGSSGLTAMEMTQRLLRMGFNVSGITDSHMMLINSTITKEKDLVIGISTSGKTIEVLNAVKTAKNNGSKILSMTSFSESELAHISDYQMFVYNSLFIDNKRFVNSQFAIMYLVDIISMKLLEDDQYSYVMSQTVDAIIKKVNEKTEE